MSINPNNVFNDSNNHPFSNLIELLKKKGKPRTLEAGELILEEGQPCDFCYYIESGKFRAFRKLKGREVIIGFSFKGDLDTCTYSFFNNTISLDNIEAITRSEVLIIQKSDLALLVHQNEQTANFITYMLSTYVETLTKRFLQFKAFTAEDIYLQLLRKQPEEVEGIPLKYLASYLGITQERLSRIRNKISKLT